jgi:predicted transcriptional regulator with HTH domain
MAMIMSSLRMRTLTKSNLKRCVLFMLSKFTEISMYYYLLLLFESESQDGV